MDQELTQAQELLLADAERLVRQEKLRDFFNSPRQFFRRLCSAYYDERLIFALRWMAAQSEESDGEA